MDLQINSEVMTVYTIVLKDFLRAKHREVIQIKDLKVESYKTLAIDFWDHLLVVAEVVNYLRELGT